MKKILDALAIAEKATAGAALCIMVILTAGNVIARKLFSTSWSFTEEITCVLFILVTMIGAAVAARNGSHIGLTFITDLLPKRLNKPLAVLSLIIAAIFAIILLVTGIGMVKAEIASGMSSAALHIREWIYGMTIPIGAVLILIHFAENNIKAFLKKEEE
jgi:TRAP-type C4-dicarboxylate transport system permease small subunit